ncbi:MAG: integration host factor subunit alpha [Proteobacteria bacterium]|nr:integration host factor subunit alpha [Pseudomonadota bacterium]
MTLTKNELVEIVQERLGIQRNSASENIEILLEIIKETLQNGEDFLVSGFGKFCVKDKTSRKGRNPSTGDTMVLPKRRVVTFKCSSNLKNKINHNEIGI